MPHVFRPSLRAVVLQSVLLATTSWLLLRVGLQMEDRGATVVTVGALACLLAIRMAWQRPSHEVVVDDESVRIVRPEGERAIPLGSIERVELDAGELSDGGHTVHVGFARVVPRQGAEIAFSDLSSLGGPNLRTPDARAEIVNVGDPELLVAIIAERAGALGAVTRDGDDDGPGPLRQAWSPAPVTAARALVMFVAVRSVAASFAADGGEWLAATSGALAVVGAHALGRYAVQRTAGRSPSERGAPAGAAISCALAAGLALLPRDALPPTVAPWALASALLLCLPAWPLPGGYIARRAGRALAGAPVLARAALVGALGVGVALLFATGHVLLALALAAGLFEATDGYHASLRHEVLGARAALQRLPVARLARLRARLRPFSDDAVEGSTRGRDHFELSLARQEPPPPQPLLLASLALSMVLVAGVAARLLDGDDPSARLAVQWLLR